MTDAHDALADLEQHGEDHGRQGSLSSFESLRGR